MQGGWEAGKTQDRNALMQQKMMALLEFTLLLYTVHLNDEMSVGWIYGVRHSREVIERIQAYVEATT